MVRILQCVNKMDRAGLETMLMNYYRYIDKSKIQFDFLTHRDLPGAYDEEIRKLGGNVFYAPRLVPSNIIKYRKYMKKLFENNQYDIIHSHIDTMSFFPLREAKRNGIKYRISHSHTSKLDIDYKLLIKYYCKLFINKYSNIRFACGNKAGKFLYKNLEYRIVNNAIECDKFSYNEKIRSEVRKKFNISDSTIVLGHVGRYIYIKNQMFLIDVFKEYLKYNSDAKLLLVGLGKDEKKLKNKVNNLNLNNKTLFLTNRSDVNELYQAMDIFVMPSLFEGIPLVAVEAQSNGLTCILSDRISNETKLTSNVYFHSLESGAKEWADFIYSLNLKRSDSAIEDVKKNGYDIKIEAKKLEDFYINLSKKGEIYE